MEGFARYATTILHDHIPNIPSSEGSSTMSSLCTSSFKGGDIRDEMVQNSCCIYCKDFHKILS
jgi:hypothetical protein